MGGSGCTSVSNKAFLDSILLVSKNRQELCIKDIRRWLFDAPRSFTVEEEKKNFISIWLFDASWSFTVKNKESGFSFGNAHHMKIKIKKNIYEKYGLVMHEI